MRGLLACSMASFVILAGAARGQGAEDLGPLLERVGRTVEVFWKDFSSMTCTEQILQEKFGKSGKIAYRQESTYDYLMLLTFDGNDPVIEESRVLQKQTVAKGNPSLLVTNGFPTLLLVFHPYYRGGYEFLRLDDETLDGKVMNRIQFRHVRGAPSTTSLRLRERDFPLDLQGTAWIEPDSARIARIAVRLTAPLTDLGLQSLRADVRYEGLHLNSGDQIHWLPSTAMVEVETARQHWRNNHRFNDYRQFSVKSESVVSP